MQPSGHWLGQPSAPLLEQTPCRARSSVTLSLANRPALGMHSGLCFIEANVAGTAALGGTSLQFFWLNVQSTPRCVMRLLCSPFMPPMGHRYLQVGKSDMTGWQIRHYGQDHAMRLDGQLNNAQQLC